MSNFHALRLKNRTQRPVPALPRKAECDGAGLTVMNSYFVAPAWNGGMYMSLYFILLPTEICGSL